MEKSFNVFFAKMNSGYVDGNNFKNSDEFLKSAAKHTAVAISRVGEEEFNKLLASGKYQGLSHDELQNLRKEAAYSKSLAMLMYAFHHREGDKDFEKGYTKAAYLGEFINQFEQEKKEFLKQFNQKDKRRSEIVYTNFVKDLIVDNFPEQEKKIYTDLLRDLTEKTVHTVMDDPTFYNGAREIILDTVATKLEECLTKDNESEPQSINSFQSKLLQYPGHKFQAQLLNQFNPNKGSIDDECNVNESDERDGKTSDINTTLLSKTKIPLAPDEVSYLNQFGNDRRKHQNWFNVINRLKVYEKVIGCQGIDSQGLKTEQQDELMRRVPPETIQDCVNSIRLYSKAPVEIANNISFRRQLSNVGANDSHNLGKRILVATPESINESIVGCKKSYIMEYPMYANPEYKTSKSMMVPFLKPDKEIVRPICFFGSGVAGDCWGQPEAHIHINANGDLKDQAKFRLAYKNLLSQLNKCSDQYPTHTVVLPAIGTGFFTELFNKEAKQEALDIIAEEYVEAIAELQRKDRNVAFSSMQADPEFWQKVNNGLKNKGRTPLVNIGSMPGNWMTSNMIIAIAADPSGFSGNGGPIDVSHEGVASVHSLMHRIDTTAGVMHHEQMFSAPVISND